MLNFNVLRGNWYQFFYRGIILLLPFVISNCVSHESLINFQQAKLENLAEEIGSHGEVTIQPDDLLRITVHSYNLDAANPFNIESQEGGNNQMRNLGGGGGQANNLELFIGYLVDDSGHVDFPVIGPIKLEGLTITEAKEKILSLVKPYLSDAVINMRLLNFKVTILGEVNAPGTVRLTNKRVTMLEAVGMARDFTPYANRNNVLLIREKDGKRKYLRFDLQSDEIFTSPYYYLEQNDILYIEPVRARVATVSDPAQRAISYTSAGLSLITLIVALFTR